MGTWGTEINDNDTALDVSADYYSFHGTMPVEEIMKKITVFYKEKIKSHEDSNNFWFAIALAQWETNTLQSDVLEKVKIIIESGADILLWEELKASAKDIEESKIKLVAFLTQLQTQTISKV